jgi:hypothetical protein
MTLKQSDGTSGARIPLEIHETGDGWTVTCYRSDGHVRHVAYADTEIEAYRIAHSLVHLYNLTGTVLISSSKGEAIRDIERLMHPHAHAGAPPSGH